VGVRTMDNARRADSTVEHLAIAGKKSFDQERGGGGPRGIQKREREGIALERLDTKQVAPPDSRARLTEKTQKRKKRRVSRHLSRQGKDHSTPPKHPAVCSGAYQLDIGEAGAGNQTDGPLKQ